MSLAAVLDQANASDNKSPQIRSTENHEAGLIVSGARVAKTVQHRDREITTRKTQEKEFDRVDMCRNRTQSAAYAISREISVIVIP